MEYKRKHQSRKPNTKHQAFRIVLRDVFLFILALNTFAIFHHVLPRKLKPVDASRYAAVTSEPVVSDSPSSSADSTFASPRLRP